MADPGNIGGEHVGGAGAALPPRIPDHVLLHAIGRGSYGEVWLARNATGALRAVKIVRRARFDDERPYEREFSGLKHFEPISRTHEGLVDILQVGRNDAEGFFYYIMEAADAQIASAEPGPVTAPAGSTTATAAATGSAAQDEGAIANYRPRTLESRIRAEGRLPAGECARVCAVLADALKCLHALGLVHRDIKPSNIIFVGGVPKLADVGLVARSDSARTFVGTEGFVPPEGPGTAQADIYSLGKCLYEMAMGKDRQAFPSPPTHLGELADREELLELNEILDRACAPAPKERYRDAAALWSDLAMLQAGGSVRGRRRARRLRRRVLWMVTTLLVVVATVVCLRRHRFEVVADNPPPPGFEAREGWLGHYDSDGEPDLYFASNQQLLVSTLRGTEYARQTWTEEACTRFEPSLVADVDGDGSDNLVVETVAGTNVAIRVFNRRLYQTIVRTDVGGFTPRKGTNEPPAPSSQMRARRFFPATNGLPNRLLTETTHGFPMLPRRLRMVSLDADARVLWEYPMASPCAIIRNPVSCADLNGDGLEDLVIGTYSPSNGVRLVDGRDDSHSEILILSHDGAPLGRFVTGGTFVITEPRVEHLDGKPVIFALAYRDVPKSLDLQSEMKGSDADLLPEGHIYKLAPDGTLLALWSSTNCVSSFLVARLPGFEKPVVLATDASGYLSVLSSDTLTPLRPPILITPRVLDFVESRLVGVEDLDGDGRYEVVLLGAQETVGTNHSAGRPDDPLYNGKSRGGELIVLGADLRLLAKRAFPTEYIGGSLPRVFIIHSRTSDHPLLLVEDQRLTLLRFH